MTEGQRKCLSDLPQRFRAATAVYRPAMLCRMMMISVLDLHTEYNFMNKIVIRRGRMRYCMFVRETHEPYNRVETFVRR